MDTNARLDWIERSLLHLATEDTAKDLVLLAVIAAHPNPKAVKFALQAALADYEATANETGFSRDWEPNQLHEIKANLRQVVERWIRRVPA